MEECIFCKIIDKQIPAFVVYDDDKWLAFLDIRPLNKGHTLVIPKQHYRWVHEVPDFGEYWEVAKRIAQAIMKSMDAFTVSFVTMGFEAPHAHIWIVPRYKDDGHEQVINWANIKEIPKEEMAEIAKKISENIPEAEAPAEMAMPVAEEKEEEKKEEPGRSEKDVYYMKREMEMG